MVSVSVSDTTVLSATFLLPLFHVETDRPTDRWPDRQTDVEYSGSLNVTDACVALLDMNTNIRPRKPNTDACRQTPKQTNPSQLQLISVAVCLRNIVHETTAGEVHTWH